MGLMDIFKRKPSAEPSAPTVGYPVPMGMQVPGPMPGETPTDQVMAMQQQGLTNNQIIQTLQRQGFQPQQIYDAMAQAESRGGPEPMPEAPSGGLGEFPAAGRMGGGEGGQREAPKGFEEIAESIVEEKWNEFSKELGKMNEWKETATSRLDKVDQSMVDMKSDLDNLHKAIVSKISEYDKNLLDVGTEIKAMEKVFQKVLPELTGSVAELSRITKTVKTKPAPVLAKKK
jgi:DNA-binding transcriptional MerR regulator